MLKKRSQLQSYSTWAEFFHRKVEKVAALRERVIPNEQLRSFRKLIQWLAWGSFVWNLVIFSGKKKGRLPDESYQSQNLCSLWLQTSAMWHTTTPKKYRYNIHNNMFIYLQINHLHEWQKENKIKTKGPSMRTFSMPISIPWTSTAMSALQFQMIFKSNSSPSYLKPKAPWQIWLQFLKKHLRNAKMKTLHLQTITCSYIFHTIRIICTFLWVLLHLDSMSGNWFCFPCATPISRISGCFSPKEKVLKETVPKTEGKASCHIKWFVMKSSRRKNTTFPGALQKKLQKIASVHDMFFFVSKKIRFPASFCGSLFGCLLGPWSSAPNLWPRPALRFHGCGATSWPTWSSANPFPLLRQVVDVEARPWTQVVDRNKNIFKLGKKCTKNDDFGGKKH